MRHFAPISALALAAAVALAAGGLTGCAAETSPFSTATYAPSELDVEVTAEADDADRLTVSADVHTARLGNASLRAEGDDTLVAAMGATETTMAWSSGFHSATVADDPRGDLSVVLTRGGERHPLPIPLVRAFSVVTTSRSARTLTIDLSPRPQLATHTTAIVRVEGCYDPSPTLVARSFPFAIDLTTLRRDPTSARAVRGASGEDGARGDHGEGDDCVATLHVDVEARNVQPYANGGGPLGAGSVVLKARRTAKTSFAVK